MTYLAYQVDINAPPGTINPILDPPDGGPFNLGFLHHTKICTTPEVFYCPSGISLQNDAYFISRFGTDNPFAYKSYHAPGHPWPWNNMQDTLAGARQYVRAGYMYFPQSLERNINYDQAYKIAAKIDKLNPEKSVCTEILYSWTTLPHCKGNEAFGINTLFGDGHVNFCQNQEAFDEDIWPLDFAFLCTFGPAFPNPYKSPSAS